MVPRNKRNRKLQYDVSCPGCGMMLDDRKTAGYTLGSETYCCQSCADGTGCTCTTVKMARPKAANRRGDIGQRNPENSVRDRNFNAEINTSGEQIGGNRQETRKPIARILSMRQAPRPVVAPNAKPVSAVLNRKARRNVGPSGGTRGTKTY